MGGKRVGGGWEKDKTSTLWNKKNLGEKWYYRLYYVVKTTNTRPRLILLKGDIPGSQKRWKSAFFNTSMYLKFYTKCALEKMNSTDKMLLTCAFACGSCSKKIPSGKRFFMTKWPVSYVKQISFFHCPYFLSRVGMRVCSSTLYLQSALKPYLIIASEQEVNSYMWSCILHKL